MKALYVTNIAYDSILIVNEAYQIQTVFSPADKAEIQQVVCWDEHVAPWECWTGMPPEPDESPADYGAIILERDTRGRITYSCPEILAERQIFWSLPEDCHPQ